MNIKQAKEVTKAIFKSEPTLVVCWVGGSGLGKTTMARDLCDDLGKKWAYAPIRTEDAMGLNLPNKARDEIDFVPHRRMAAAVEEEAFIYVDELNRVDRHARTAVMELLGERSIGGIKLHPKSTILLTLNDESENYDTIEGDKAFKTRCVCLPVEFDADTSFEWAKKKGYARMADFIKKNPQALNEKVTWSVKPDTRLLEYLDRFSLVPGVPNNLYNEAVQFILGKELCKPFLKDKEKEGALEAMKIGTSMFDFLNEVGEIVGGKP